MVTRPNPMVRSCQNLVYNLRNRQLNSKYPRFRALNHPFCTNTQLQNASYTHWMVQTSRDIPSKIFQTLMESQHKYESFAPKTPPSKFEKLAPTSAFYHLVDQNNQEDIASISSTFIEDFVKSSEFSKGLRSFDIKEVHHRLSVYHRQGKYVAPAVVNDIIASCVGESNTVEDPRFLALAQLDLTPGLRAFYESVPYVYDICKMYEEKCIKNVGFQQHYIWACYHMNDMDTLQRLVGFYLKNPSLNSKYLSYLTSAFILNYDVAFCKDLLENIIDMRLPLALELLETVILRLVSVGAVFEIILAVFQKWSISENCQKPSGKACSSMLAEAYAYGTDSEIAQVKEHVDPDHFMVKCTELQQQIISRDPYSIKKSVTRQDFEHIQTIARSLDTQAQKQVYHSFLSFLAKYSNIKAIQVVLLQMKEQDLSLDEVVPVVVQYYNTHGEFMTLVNLLMELSKEHKFRLSFVKSLYETYVQTYPYEAAEFNVKFKQWIDQNTELDQDDKKKLLRECRIVKIRSNLTPYNLHRSVLDQNSNGCQKYDERWTKVDWALNPLTGAVANCKQQIEFRVNRGFEDIIRKGYKPDFSLLETTFRRLHSRHRQVVYNLAKTLRMNKKMTKLDVISLQFKNANKETLREYYKQNKHLLNSNNKLMLARMFCNKQMFDETSEILSSICDSDITDRNKMVKLVTFMRVGVNMSRFEEVVRAIEDFPIDKIVLSPFLRESCLHIEKKLILKLSVTEKKISVGKSTEEYRKRLVAALERLRGLIGDVEVRLHQDKKDVAVKVGEMFRWLDKWMNV